MTQKEKQERREAMFKLVEEYHSSGRSQLSFSKLHGIAKTTFQNWCKKYKEHNKQVINKQPARHFMPVQVGPVETGSFSAELVFPNGVCLKLTGVADIDLVGQLVNSYHNA